MSTSIIALGIASALVFGLVFGLFGLSLLSGAVDFLFGKPRLDILKTKKGVNGFAFRFKWNSAKEPASFDHVKVRLFNPFGRPTQAEAYQKFDPIKGVVALDLDMGPAMAKIHKAKGVDKAIIQIEFSASRDGIVHQFDMKGASFFKKLDEAKDVLNDDQEEASAKVSGFVPFWTNVKLSVTADTVPGQGAHLKVATNPSFAHAFGSPVPGSGHVGGKDAGGADVAAEENFLVSKVWIEPGCIVCDACETIYPEVFDVQADTCYIKPEATPGSELLTNGLLIQEAAEACPVEVIKYNKA